MNEASAIADLLLMLLTHPRTGVLIALLLVAAAIDWRTYRIPNWLTVGGMVYALACNAALAPSALTGGLHALGGLLVGLVVLLPMYVLRVMGAGDVKLMAAVGAFMGPAAALEAVLFAMVAGGAIALASILAGGLLNQLISNLSFMSRALLRPNQLHLGAGAGMPSVGKLPFALGICSGTLVFLLTRYSA